MMQNNTSTKENTLPNKKKILVVTSDLPSHPYACVKLAKVLAEGGHNVTIAAPNGSAYQRIKTEIARWVAATQHKQQEQTHFQDDDDDSRDRYLSNCTTIKCISVGNVQTKVHVNVRPVIDPQQSSTFELIYNSIFRRGYNPFPFAEGYEAMMDNQDEIYDTLKQIIANYDLIYAIHSVAATVCDAIDSVQNEISATVTTTENVPKCIIFSSLPYDSSLYREEGDPRCTWRMPRSIVSLPHVATYSSPSLTFGQYGAIFGIIAYLVQLFWMALDAYNVERAWRIAGRRNDERRIERGLRPVKQRGQRYYLQNYPVLSFGGIHPFIAKGEEIADNVTVIGSIETTNDSAAKKTPTLTNQPTAEVDIGRLNEWLCEDTRNNSKSHDDNIVYISFGTGTQLTEEEASKIANLALSLKSTKEIHQRVLFALNKDEQKRLEHVFDKTIGTPPTAKGDDYMEYLNGILRIDADVPQMTLLESGIVNVFVSHMGFGGYSEGVRAGVPFVAYPAGLDQWYNAERAIEAGVALRAGKNMTKLESAVRDAIRNNERLIKKSNQLKWEAAQFDSNSIVLSMVEN